MGALVTSVPSPSISSATTLSPAWSPPSHLLTLGHYLLLSIIYYLLSTIYCLLSTVYPAIYCRYDSPHARVVSESVAVWSALAVDLESEPLGVSVGFLQHEEGGDGEMTVIHSPTPAPTPV